MTHFFRVRVLVQMQDMCDFELHRSIRTQVIVLTSYGGHTDPRTDAPMHAHTHARTQPIGNVPLQLRWPGDKKY